MNHKKKNNDSEVERLASIEKLSSIYKTATQLQKEYIIEESKKSLTYLINEVVEDYNDICKNQSKLFEFDWNNEVVFKEFYTSITYVVVYHALINPSESKGIFDKIKTTSFLKKTFKWFIPFNELQNELDKLRLIYPNLNEDLFKFHIINYIKTNISITILKKVDMLDNTNHTPQLYKYIENFKVRRRKSPNTVKKHIKTTIKTIQLFSKKESTTNKKKKLDKLFDKNEGKEIDYFFNPLINIYSTIMEKSIGTKANKSIVTDLTTGKASTYMRLLPIEDLTETSQRQLFINLYPLFKLILVGEIKKELLSENEYKELDDTSKNNKSITDNNRPYENFEQYKVKKVMSILGKT